MREVVCFGEILWDIFEARARGSEPISRAFRRELGGAPANVATGLARLGVRTAVVGGVGRDRFGEALVAHLRGDGVDVRAVVKLPNRTGLTFVVRDAHGEPEFIFYRHESADVSIRAEHITPAMGRALWAVVGTSTLMTRDLARATARFVDSAKQAGAHLLVDVNVRAHLWPDRRAMQKAIASLVGRASLVKASDADLRALDGGASDPSRPIRWLERHASGASWLVTRGSGMASAIGEHGAVHVPAERARCVDATGAGDAFIAGSLATLVAARAVPGSTAWRDAAVWRAALRAGHIMGKKAVSRAGAVAGLHGLGRARAAIERARRSAQ
ncbi:MAG TPA: carbohydrate kinase [Polyangiaceae bacterium]|nr:carbohydrate kinase [Polyangiaceae bacterium]